MKSILLALLLFVCSFSPAYAQKLYVFCPEAQEVKARIGFMEGEKLNVVLFDGRQIPNKVKTDCSSEEFKAGLISIIKRSYPSVQVNILPESEYYKKADSGAVTIKLGILAYHAGFGIDVAAGLGTAGGQIGTGLFMKGQWNAVTAYSVKIFDQRVVSKPFSKEIAKVDSRSNMLGNKSAKQALSTSYTSALQELLFFIDNSLMQ